VSSREVEQTGDALRALVEGLSTSGRPSFAALANREWPRARWAQIWLSLALVVEHRNCTRYNAASGELTGAEYVAVHAARHGVAADEALSELGWPADAIDSTLDQLALRDLVIDDAVTANALAMLRELDFLAARAQREIAVRLDDNLDLDRLDAWGRVLQSSRDLCEPYRADSALALRVC
jgi:hypothetical protein